MAKLSELELAGLDFIIAARKAGVLRGGFVKDIADAVKDVAGAAVAAAGAVAVIQQVAAMDGGGNFSENALKNVTDGDFAKFSVDDLVRIRRELSK